MPSELPALESFGRQLAAVIMVAKTDAVEADDRLYCNRCFIHVAGEQRSEEIVPLTEGDLHDRAMDDKGELIDQGCSTGVTVTLECFRCYTQLHRV